MTELTSEKKTETPRWLRWLGIFACLIGLWLLAPGCSGPWLVVNHAPQLVFGPGEREDSNNTIEGLESDPRGGAVEASAEVAGPP